MAGFLTAPVLGNISRRQWCKCSVRCTPESSKSVVMVQRLGWMYPQGMQSSYSVPLLPAGGSAGWGIMLCPAPSTNSRRC